MSIRLEMTFDTVEEMLSVFRSKILPTSTAAMEVPASVVTVTSAPEPKKVAAPAKKPVAEKPAATQPASETATPAPTPEPAAPAAAAESHSEPAPASPESVKITLEFVRSKLAQLSQAGKTAQVKALLSDFGANSLSAVPPEKFADLLNKAAAL